MISVTVISLLPRWPASTNNAEPEASNNATVVLMAAHAALREEARDLDLEARGFKKGEGLYAP